MARTKKTTELKPDDVQPETLPAEAAVAVVEQQTEVRPEIPVALPVEPAPPPVQTNGNGNGHHAANGNGSGPGRPAASWKFPGPGGVTIEVALWPNSITLQSGEVIEVLNTTVTRNYKDNSGNWCKGGSFRTSELPILVHALNTAHAYALSAREMNCPI